MEYGIPWNTEFRIFTEFRIAEFLRNSRKKFRKIPQNSGGIPYHGIPLDTLLLSLLIHLPSYRAALFSAAPAPGPALTFKIKRLRLRLQLRGILIRQLIIISQPPIFNFFNFLTIFFCCCSAQAADHPIPQSIYFRMQRHQFGPEREENLKIKNMGPVN